MRQTVFFKNCVTIFPHFASLFHTDRQLAHQPTLTILLWSGKRLMCDGFPTVDHKASTNCISLNILYLLKLFKFYLLLPTLRHGTWLNFLDWITASACLHLRYLLEPCTIDKVHARNFNTYHFWLVSPTRVCRPWWGTWMEFKKYVQFQPC